MSQVESNEPEGAAGPTFLKMIYVDTSATFVKQCVEGGIQVVAENPINSLFVVNAHLQAGRPTHVAKMIEEVI